jgi:Na+/proline symporter
MMGLGGLLARALFGAALYADGASPNQALPMLFVELFPTWLAALIGVGILAAIMSTADGLVVSSSQIIANDLYRRTIAPRLSRQPTEEELDRRVLKISRVSTVFVLVVCMGMAWALIDTNIVLIVWIGIGGMMARCVCRARFRILHLCHTAYADTRPGLVRFRLASRLRRLVARRGAESVLVRGPG